MFVLTDIKGQVTRHYREIVRHMNAYEKLKNDSKRP